MTGVRTHASWRALVVVLGMVAALAIACGGDAAATGGGDDGRPVLRLGAIPDQDPERLQRTYSLLAAHLESRLEHVDVEYVPVSDYEGAVNGFIVGDLDIVWFGGLTGSQARLEVEGATAIAQRDIDARFTSVFIAGADTGIKPIGNVAELAQLAGRSFTFGSESSTSGRLMPHWFLAQAAIDPDVDFDGMPGFSGSHDATIELVAAGTYDVGVLSSQVWDDRLAGGAVEADIVVEIFRTPQYFDYHWVTRPDVDQRLGTGTVEAFTRALLDLDPSQPEEADILGLFGAGRFLRTNDANYAEIEAIARDVGLIR